MSDKLSEEKILVMFPSSKNYSEGSALLQADPTFMAGQELSKHSELPCHVSLNDSRRANTRMSLDDLIDLVDAQVHLLEENVKRMKYYLDEIDFFMPDSSHDEFSVL